MPQTMNREQIIMPVQTKVKSIYLLQAAAIVNFRMFQLLDFPKTLNQFTKKKNIVQTMINTNWLFHADIILIKTSDFWLRLNILIFDTHSLLRIEMVLNLIRDPTYTLHSMMIHWFAFYDDELESVRLKTINLKPWKPITYTNCVS